MRAIENRFSNTWKEISEQKGTSMKKVEKRRERRERAAIEFPLSRHWPDFLIAQLEGEVACRFHLSGQWRLRSLEYAGKKPTQTLAHEYQHMNEPHQHESEKQGDGRRCKKSKQWQGIQDEEQEGVNLRLSRPISLLPRASSGSLPGRRIKEKSHETHNFEQVWTRKYTTRFFSFSSAFLAFFSATAWSLASFFAADFVSGFPSGPICKKRTKRNWRRKNNLRTSNLGRTPSSGRSRRRACRDFFFLFCFERFIAFVSNFIVFFGLNFCFRWSLRSHFRCFTFLLWDYVDCKSQGQGSFVFSRLALCSLISSWFLSKHRIKMTMSKANKSKNKERNQNLKKASFLLLATLFVLFCPTSK